MLIDSLKSLLKESGFVDTVWSDLNFSKTQQQQTECCQSKNQDSSIPVNNCLEKIENKQDSQSENALCAFQNRIFNLLPNSQLSEYTLVYIGKESLSLTNILLTYHDIPVYLYSPETCVLSHQNESVNKLLARRYYCVQRAKDAHRFGIVVGTLGVGNYFFWSCFKSKFVNYFFWKKKDDNRH